MTDIFKLTHSKWNECFRPVNIPFFVDEACGVEPCRVGPVLLRSMKPPAIHEDPGTLGNVVSVQLGVFCGTAGYTEIRTEHPT